MPNRRSALSRAALCAVLALFLIFPLAADAATIMAATPISRTDLPWWRARHEAKLREIAQTKPDLIFLGNSIMQNWEKSGPPDWQDFAPAWQRFYGDRNAVNLGFTGDTTASLLWRIRNGEVDHMSPKAAVVLIGANNLGKVHWAAEDTVAGIGAIIDELHKRLPDTKNSAARRAALGPVRVGNRNHQGDQPVAGRQICRFDIGQLPRSVGDVHSQGRCESGSLL